MIEVNTPRYTVSTPTDNGLFEEIVFTSEEHLAIESARLGKGFVRDNANPGLMWTEGNGWAPWTQTIRPTVRVVVLRKITLDLDPEDVRTSGLTNAAERARAKAHREGRCLDEETLMVSEVVR